MIIIPETELFYPQPDFNYRVEIVSELRQI